MYPFEFDHRYTSWLSEKGILDYVEESVCLCFFWKNWNRPHTWSFSEGGMAFRDADLLQLWGDIWQTFSEAHKPSLQLWKEPFFYVFWVHEPDRLSLVLKRFVYEWMHFFFEHPHENLFRICRVGGAWGNAYLLQDDERVFDAWGPVFNRARTVSLHASSSPLWVEEHFYEHVYEYIPARSFPPVRVKENRERVQLFKFEWGLPGQYLFQPPPLSDDL